MRSGSSLQAALAENWQTAGFGIYVHWPFCQAKCPYCDFNSHVARSIDQSAWQAAYVSEIDRIGQETPGRVVTSIFFGGGTPSLMEPRVVDAVINRIAKTWNISNDIEITLEANPTSVEAERFRGYRAAGVNRVSLGVQALADNDLKALGRLHSANEALAAIETARETFDRVSFDLIYARQNQSRDAWQAELLRALALQPDHLSLYQLTIEDGTAFGDRFSAGKLKGLPDEDLAADMFTDTNAICEAQGLPAYEVSNHASTGEESRHNLIYWRGGDYAGLGPGAHGRLTLDGVRYATETPLAPALWLDQVTRGGGGESRRETLTVRDELSERLMMGLRLRAGVDLGRIRPLANSELYNKINDLREEGWLSLENDVLAVTPAGRPLLNAVLTRLLRD